MKSVIIASVVSAIVASPVTLIVAPLVRPALLPSPEEQLASCKQELRALAMRSVFAMADASKRKAEAEGNKVGESASKMAAGMLVAMAPGAIDAGLTQITDLSACRAKIEGARAAIADFEREGKP